MPFTPCTMTREQEAAMEVARVGFMTACPFFAHYFYAEMRECPTMDIDTAATDGRTIFYNPEYLTSLKPAERVFVLAHEVDHVICRDPQRAKKYHTDGHCRDTPWDNMQANVAADYRINANLIETGVGMMNKDWCYADDVTGADLFEDVYARKYKKPPTSYGGQGKGGKGSAGDKTAAGNNGRFDEVLPPSVDPVTGKEDLPDAAEFREAVARAAAAAKAMGKLPAAFQKMVDDILDPQVDWREHIRMILTGHMGSRHETWTRPNRRRLALNPIIITPGRRGYGANLVVVGVDTSGSIYASPKALEAFFSEVGGILADVRPKRVVLIECDAKVQRVSEAGTLDELHLARTTGVKGGGGTRFEPVFEHVAEQGWKPDSLIYLTDLQGSFPNDKPAYPVTWCSIEAGQAPFGDTVHIKV